MHLILPHAASERLPAQAIAALNLPHLQKLLAQMQPTATDRDAPDDLLPLTPAERVHARALGWPSDGPWPFAAQATGQDGAQAWLTPCHWQVGMDTVVMHDPASLGLSDEESRALMQSVQPWMAEDGLQLRWRDALHWHASGDGLGTLALASLARVSGGNIRPWLMDGRLPGRLQRLQSEMQMLLYHHPVNEAREARRLPTVNAFWLHGAGRPASATHAQDVRWIDTLSAAAALGNTPPWQAAWQQLDAEVLAPLADAPPVGLQLSLCSDTAAQTWTATAPSLWGRLKNLWQRPDPASVLQALLSPTP